MINDLKSVSKFNSEKQGSVIFYQVNEESKQDPDWDIIHETLQGKIKDNEICKTFLDRLKICYLHDSYGFGILHFIAMNGSPDIFKIIWNVVNEKDPKDNNGD